MRGAPDRLRSSPLLFMGWLTAGMILTHHTHSGVCFTDLSRQGLFQCLLHPCLYQAEACVPSNMRQQALINSGKLPRNSPPVSPRPCLALQTINSILSQTSGTSWYSVAGCLERFLPPSLPLGRQNKAKMEGHANHQAPLEIDGSGFFDLLLGRGSLTC